MISVAFKIDDCVYMASCSHGLTYHSTSYVESNMPLWAPPLSLNTLISYTGDIRPMNVIRNYKPLVSDITMDGGKLTTHYIVRHTLKNAISNLMEARCIDDDELTESIFGSMLIAKDNSLFKLDSFGYVIEIKDEIAIGTGYERALAALEVYKDIKDPILRMLKVMTDTLEVSSIGDFPILIRNTKEANKCYAFDMEAAFAYIHNHSPKGGNK